MKETSAPFGSLIENNENDIEWTVDEEIQLLFALDGLKPVGINKYFIMASIVDRLSKTLNREISPDVIWSHLRTLYNLDIFDEAEAVPFPNEIKDFVLPEEFTPFLLKKRNEIEKRLISDSSPSIIAVAMDNTGKDKSFSSIKTISSHSKDIDRKVSTKLVDLPKRAPKRTRGSMSLESNSPSTTPPPISNKRRRI